MVSSKDGVVALAGNWEPLAHKRRSGMGVVDDEAQHFACYGSKTVRKLADLGVTGVIWPGYKGLGIDHERPEWEHLKPFRSELERAGIELGVYLQCGSYFAETFYIENPEARAWTALDYWGKPHVYSEYYRRYFRHRPCLTHRAFSEYVARAARILVGEYGAVLLSCDNNAQMPCHTPYFEAAFHRFLAEKYRTDTAEGRAAFVRRYGHPHVDAILLPCGSLRRPIDCLPALPDAGLQDWVEFRCRLVAQNAAIVAEAARAANPAVRLSFNISYDRGEFHQLTWGTEPEFIAPHADFIFSEDDNAPRLTDDGRLISHVHTCKHLRALGVRGQFHPAPYTGAPASRHGAARSILELAVHNQGALGPVFEENFDLAAEDPRPAAIRLVRRHEAVFTFNSTVASIALLRGRHAVTLNWQEATEGRLLAEQALYQAGLQFDVVTEGDLADLSGDSLLILPETISTPEACVRQIADFVRGGGRLLAVGAALSRDEWGRCRAPRVPPAPRGESSPDFATVKDEDLDKAVLAAWLGIEDRYRHRIAAFPRLLHPAPLVWDTESARIPVMGNRYHTLPVNRADFEAAVRRGLGTPPVVEILDRPSPHTAIPTLLRSKRDGTLSLHILNYADAPVERLRLRVNLPVTPRGARWLGAFPERAADYEFRPDASGAELILPVPGVYAGIVFKA